MAFSDGLLLPLYMRWICWGGERGNVMIDEAVSVYLQRYNGVQQQYMQMIADG